MLGSDGIVERRDSAFYKSFAIRMPPDLISPWKRKYKKPASQILIGGRR
jgi:hypothetical protein